MLTEEAISAVDALETALCDPALEQQVEMVLTRPAPGTYRARAVDGSVTFRRVDEGTTYRYEVLARAGRDPHADQAADRFVGHATERASRFPHRTANAYPFAFDSIAQFFDGRHSPELVAVHTSHHHFDDHLGQHGSPGAVQARAPFLAGGAGVRPLGVVDRATRIVNVAPTIAALLGVAPHPAGAGPTGARDPGALLRRQDGEVEWEVLTGDRAEHVVVFLLDGCNCNLLLDAVEAGEAPNLASIVERGTAFRHGAMASLPTATLANHTTAMTGAHPGHSGVLHNTWHDRDAELTADLLAMDQMFFASQHLDERVETLFEAVNRSRPGAFTTATFEFADRGASFSSFGLLRDGPPPAFPRKDDLRHLDAEHAAASREYAFMSTVDHVSMTHTVEAWEQRHGNPLPALSWCALALTDEAGHESGPHGTAARAAVRDSDARVGEVLRAVERAGVTDRTAFVVIADHGMEQNDPANSSSWHEAIEREAAPFLEVGESFFYLRRVTA